MTAPAGHRSRVIGSPLAGVHGTLIESDRRYGKHWHATYGVGLLEAGAQSSASGRGEVDAYAGDLITTNPGEVHDGRPLGAPARRWRMIYLEPEVLRGMLDDPGAHAADALALTRPVMQDGRLRASLSNCLRRMETGHAAHWTNPLHRLAFEEALVETCGMLLARHATAAMEAAPRMRVVPGRGEPPGDPIARARQRIADDPLDAPGLSELAALAQLSKYQFLRRFAQRYGLTPHAWLLVRRVEHARRLIAAGQTLAESAAASGFADQAHMSRLFLRHFGYTPGAWRAAQHTALRPGG